jgi:hypothetical protein
LARTKAQVLAKIKEFEIADLRCSEIKSQQLVEFARSLKVQPQTRANYLSHLAAIFRIARPLWGYPLDLQQIQDAMVAMRKLGTIRKGNSRDRRPTLEELDRLMTHFENIRAHRPGSVPMTNVIAFAIFSTRRQEEFIRITWADYDKTAQRVWVRDMKNPGDKREITCFASLRRKPFKSSTRCPGLLSKFSRSPRTLSGRLYPRLPSPGNRGSAFPRSAA